jgi:hypothetical protein
VSALDRLAQQRANNTGRTYYVVRDGLTDRTKVKAHPAKISGDKILKIVTPDAEVRAQLLKRRKTRGGNRVRVGSNVR